MVEHIVAFATAPDWHRPAPTSPSTTPSTQSISLPLQLSLSPVDNGNRPAAAPLLLCHFAATTDLSHAVFVFCIDRDDEDNNPSRRPHHQVGKHRSGNVIHGGGFWWGTYDLGNFPNSDRSSSSIGGFDGPTAPKGISKKNRSLLKTSSSSSSSGSNPSVSGWTNAEAYELQVSAGFSLLIYMWRS